MKMVLQEFGLVVLKRRKTRKRYYKNLASGTKKKKNMKKVLQELRLVVLKRRKTRKMYYKN